MMWKQCVVIVLALALLFSCKKEPIFFEPDKEPFIPQPFAVEYEFVLDVSYDSTSLRGTMNGGYKTFTYWTYLESSESLEKLADRDKMNLPEELAFDGYGYIVTYGRRMHAIEGTIIDWSISAHEYSLKTIFVITFEENYQGDRAFFYRIEEPPYAVVGGNPPIYIMRDDEQVYITDNIYWLNQILNEEERFAA